MSVNVQTTVTKMISKVNIVLAISLVLISSVFVSSHGFNFNDRRHLQAHMQGELDLSFVSEQDLQFLYFQSHDAEGNNKLDGCELVQSLLHFRSEEAEAYGQPPKLFSDVELSMVVDPLLAIADRNKDGFIDYPEFVTGQPVKGF